MWGLNIPMPRVESSGYELPGGTAIDYSDHICESIDNLARLYSLHTETDYLQCRSKLVGNISNCMTDRAAAKSCCDSPRERGVGQNSNRAELPPSPPRYDSQFNLEARGIGERKALW